VIYYELTRRLEHDEKFPDRPRRRLNQQLDVASWYVPGGVFRRRRDESVAPSWWRGDEDASQTFLHAMGVVNLT